MIMESTDITALEKFGKQLAETILAEVRRLLAAERRKEWYTVDELAEAMGKKPFTVREKWCNSGRIECQKDPYSGKWRIPAAEYDRLTAGGGIRAKERVS
jgi:DNA-binding transcriptional ArsR family regulator